MCVLIEPHISIYLSIYLCIYTLYSSLGERLLIKTETPQEDVDNNLLNQYHCHRLSCGVAEGMEELPPGQCLPFDINIDYLQGGNKNRIN